MKSKSKDRTNHELPRQDLSKIIPLESPFVLMVDPSSSCNLRCLFCPTGDTSLIQSTKRFQGYMELDVYKKIISDLDQFEGKIKTLRLYKEGDPLVNPNLVEFIEIAKRSSKIERIDTTTNAIILNKNISKRLINSGIDQINISINGVSSQQYKKLTKVEVNFDRLVDQIAYLHSISGNCEIYIKAIRENLSEEEQVLFYKIFSEISDRIFLEGIQPNWPKFNFTYVKPKYITGHYGQPLEEREVCPYIFYIMVINSDGSVSACVQDWPHELIVGDIKSESVKNIWSGEKLKSLQKLHLRGRRCEVDLCSICPVLKHGCLDNIDLSASEILQRI